MKKTLKVQGPVALAECKVDRNSGCKVSPKPYAESSSLKNNMVEFRLHQRYLQGRSELVLCHVIMDTVMYFSITHQSET